MRLILASRSPQRITLLREAQYVFDCDPADIDEEAYPRDLSPPAIARWLASAKANRVLERHPNDCILAADTVVALGNELLGKPEDPSHARQMLSQLSGSTHLVTTGIALICKISGTEIIDHITSRVQMRLLTDAEIDEYVASNDWQGKAGGYGLQDDDPFVACMEGSHTNVIGLPMERIATLPLNEFRGTR